MSIPKVSVCMLAYNHARFLDEALRSVLAQETQFPIEIVIGEDCSTDGTSQIVTRWQQAHPALINALLRGQNLGMMPNAIATYEQCRGEYIAFLEGDDYWTDPLKLQRQVDALEAHPEWSGCFHRVQYVSESGASLGKVFPDRVRSEVDFEELCAGNPIQTCSLILRRSALSDIPDWLCGLSMGDWPICLLAALNGPLGMLPDVMACYRVHRASYWSSQTWLQRTEQFLSAYPVLAAHLPSDRTLSLIRGQQRFASHLAREYAMLRHSLSLRVGRAVTWPLRTLYDLWQASNRGDGG